MLIQKLRLQRAWSQEQLAEISGLSVRTIQRLERGQAPSLESMRALGAAFGIDLSALKEPDMSTLDASVTPRNAPSLSPDEALALAHVRKVKSFYMHVAQYCGVMLVLTAINLTTSPHYLWAVWPALGWGVGLTFHGLQTFDRIPFLNGDWERRQVEKRLGRRL